MATKSEQSHAAVPRLVAKNGYGYEIFHSNATSSHQSHQPHLLKALSSHGLFSWKHALVFGNGQSLATITDTREMQELGGHEAILERLEDDGCTFPRHDRYLIDTTRDWDEQ
ncbi:MAG: hypothetical protein GOMPHAMPRED_001242 [Gomphillus americanus]|uniref:Uncharacterized protein n=1 Tax=Gomphillus americanus TaxID=1940652 RepID=A0A8H3F2U3_9LECA|nr:MAG: hypothetical protein GOMPHAMPRED_001242 [Gomphillus americanus]